MKEARYYVKRDKNRVDCGLCPHECTIADGKRGVCGVRENRNGALFALTYGRVASAQMDPIEKKPLYHYFPGSSILSLGSVGCNFACGFCQNWSLVTSPVPRTTCTATDVVELARKHASIGVAYTYNEPFIWHEFLMDAGIAVKEAGFSNVLVTNGFINPEPLSEILPIIDAMNIDLKSMDDEFYKTHCRGRLEPVLDTIRTASKACLVEVTNLIIPGHNDTDEHFIKLTDFIADTDPDIPLHLSRYFPHRSFAAPPTPEETMMRAYSIAREKLNYVYVGNMRAVEGQDSICPHCKSILVKRSGYSTHITGIDGSRCSSCGADVHFITEG
ncbi:MAG: AmmeMemoRadiSam system radical SAM enzyme [Deltaproteobacteria bacterium]|nr:AmmeMemoRadiSam system radical SAM enzyme [Candidatus Zymogenaceae bacterium]